MKGMKNKLMLAAAAVIMVGGAGTASAQRSRSASRTAAAPARLGGKPNLNGIWQAMNTAFWNVEPHSAGPAPQGAHLVGATGAIPAGLGVVEGGTIPYKPEALAKRNDNMANTPTKDPEAACYLPGIPRATYMNYPFQIVQADNGDMLFVYEYASANRVVHMQPVEVPPIDTWMGTSYGQWEGDTLKVTTLALSPGDVKMPGGALEPGVTWIDRAGNYLTNTATVTERFTPADASHIKYEVTIEDPETYTKPWKMSMTLYKNVEPNAQLLEFKCVPFAEDLLYGDLLLSPDAPPALRKAFEEKVRHKTVSVKNAEDAGKKE